MTLQESTIYLIATISSLLLLYWLLSVVIRRYGKDPKFLLPRGSFKKLALPLALMFLSVVIRTQSLRELLGLATAEYWFKKASTLLFIFSFTWFTLVLLNIAKRIILGNYDLDRADNLKARKIYTQFNVLERIVIFIIVILALGALLMSFEPIREIGISVFASAGVAGIIIGFSAQKFIGTILAGIQIAIAQPIKLDDVVIVEGESRKLP